MSESPPPIPRRPGKELRERALALAALVVLSPLLATAVAAIVVEGLLDRRARGPVFFREVRFAGGRAFDLLKLRTLDAAALASLGPGPTHIKLLEADHTTRVGNVLRQWYLDELPQLWNIVRGDMLLIGTRPFPVELYEEELARGVTRKRDMPGGLIGPVQASKGATFDTVATDLEYLDLLRTGSAWQLLRTDVAIVRQSLRVVVEHKGL